MEDEDIQDAFSQPKSVPSYYYFMIRRLFLTGSKYVVVGG